MRIYPFLLASGACLAPSIALAQPQPPALPPANAAPPGAATGVPVQSSGTRSTQYEASYFAPFAPRTALDIARQVPGFSLDLGDVEVRGFAGAVGNVVINGARPSSKSESLETLLSRIPASRVQRVEVGSGSLYGADYAAKGQVLNIVMTAASGFDGEVSASASRDFTGHIEPNASVTALLKRGDSSFNLSAGTQRDDQAEEGYDNVFDFASGALVEHRDKVNRIRDHSPFLSGSWSLERGDSNAVHLNARWNPATFYLKQTNRVTPVDGDQRDDLLFQDYKRPTIEIGGDISRPIAGGTVKLVGLASRSKRDDRDKVLNRGLGGTPNLGGFEQEQEASLQETIGRLSYARPSLFGFTFESGVEVAFNKLDSSLGLFVIDESGEREKIDLPIEDATVSELRGEGYVNAGKAIAKDLRLDLGLRYEISRLKVRGDALADRSLQFFKPSVTLDWRPNKAWHTQASLRRTVAQLDFYDFISSAELSNDRVNGGNADLMPQRAWEARLLAERPIMGDGQLKLQVGYDLVSKLQDRVLVVTDEGTFDAPGNLGTGRRMFASIDIDAPLAKWGLEGVRVRGNATLQRTRVEDPISYEQRRWTDYWPAWEWYVEARRDKGPFSFGAAISDRDSFYIFRTDEIYSNRNGGPFATAFAEYRPDARTTIRLDVDNVADVNAVAHRVLYNPNRLQPQPEFIEDRVRFIHVGFGLSVKRSFGGGGTKAPAE
ncbi:TonB-dependent receptor [Sphingomonas sabuli]|uniref:TonB-dependent receptor n=1 Tax=Sphingomonas sabuli TaxID=2764186 RepID=A0A7G9L3K9_9SPHN|nr:TonB-dependent receptor [Sphingomonas sabuli]QNM83208.1 TonB-dependent receptor [Sphingomonas sabuli]